MSEISQNIAKVKQRIHAAALACGRDPQEITLLAVSKTKPELAVREAVAAGQLNFGENYLQEAVEKITALRSQSITGQSLTWHFIGPIQSNKTRAIAQHFQWVHAVDRLKIAERLSAHCSEDLPEKSPCDPAPLNICIQVNIDNEASKSGVLSSQVLPLAQAINALPYLRLRGLMAIPQVLPSGANEAAFEKMNMLFNTIKNRNEFAHWDTLSMGMSGDLECAIAHGATIVRVGTDIFGQRDYSQQFE